MARASSDKPLLLVGVAATLRRALARPRAGDRWRRCLALDAAAAGAALAAAPDALAVVALAARDALALLASCDATVAQRIVVVAARRDRRLARLPAGVDVAYLPASATELRRRLARAAASALDRRELGDARAKIGRQQQFARLGDFAVDWRAQRIECSAQARQIFGLDDADGTTTFAALTATICAPERAAWNAWWCAVVSGSEARQCEQRLLRRDGSERVVRIHAEPRHGSAVAGAVDAIVHDVTDRRRVEEELAYQATHDELTGLANRRQLLDHLKRVLGSDGDATRRVAVLFLDLDRFKDVNESLGQALGDRLLVEVANRLRASARAAPDAPAEEPRGAGDLVGRPGGDEFTLVIAGLRGADEACRIAQRTLAALAEPITLGTREFFLSACIGVAVSPAAAIAPDELVKQAETAMYAAKELGRGSFALFDPAMERGTDRRLAVESELRHGLERGEIEVWYQPRIDLARTRIVGFEALARWRHPELGLVAPSGFIAIAEESGLILPLGLQVLRDACEQARSWLDAGFGDLRMAVNLSSAQFRDRSLVDQVDGVLASSGLPAGALELELTESALMRDVDRGLETLTQLKERGVHLAIDDFGTGYSSLSYLKRLPIDCLKIDRSFIHDVTTDSDAAAIASLIVMMAHRMRLVVVAEGAETKEQVEFLRRERCDQVQGFYFSKPLPAAAATALLERQIVHPVAT